ncbi:MAG: DUF4290 domain-containing protein [Bacteroidales bacterium]|nr:DUF4290 domain-containing protein [Bacteroidales bacterium]
MEYNTKREVLVVPEYGRNVQKMVEYCLTIEDREKRNEYAQSIIVAMGQVNPAGKDSPNYERRLWDHLFIISDYKLDVDSPYPKPLKAEKDAKPERLHYKNSNITFRTYGTLLEKMIKKVSVMEDGEEKKYLVGQLAQGLKKAHLQWNINTCDDDVILKHLNVLSDGKLNVEDGFQFKTTKEILAKKTNTVKNQPQKKQKKVIASNNKQK